jgi:uncharacterized membrane protein
MTNFLRSIAALLVACLTFAVVFLSVFVPLLLWDMHVAPHDGQGGMGGFFPGLPMATIAWFVALIVSYRRMAKQGLFEPPVDDPQRKGQ